MYSRLFGIVLVFAAVGTVCAQDKVPAKWSLLTAYEVNYTGNNAVLHAVYKPHKKQTIEVGLNYNFSDGFAANPVVGLGISYSYSVLQTANWEATIGVDYRRQKPIAIVNIQTITYTTQIAYTINKRWSAFSRIGYGLAAERARSAGPFTQSNNITGSLSLGCVFHL